MVYRKSIDKKIKLKNTNSYKIGVNMIMLLMYVFVIIMMMYSVWRESVHTDTAGAADTYINIADSPTYVKSGFSLEDITSAPETAFPAGYDAAPNEWRYFGESPGARYTGTRQIDTNLFRNAVPGEVGEYTILMTFEADSDFIESISASHEPGFFLAAIGDNWEVYLNGSIINSEQTVIHEAVSDSGSESIAIKSHRTRANVFFSAESQLFRNGTNFLAFRIIGDPGVFNTGLHRAGPYYIDNFKFIESHHTFFGIIFLCGVCFFAGIYNLTLYCSQWKKKLTLYFSIGAFLMCLYNLCKTPVVIEIVGDSDTVARFEYIVMYLMICCIGIFFEYAAKDYCGKITKIMCGVLAATSVLIAVIPNLQNLIGISYFGNFALLVFCAYEFVMIILRFRSEVRIMLSDEGLALPHAVFRTLTDTVIGGILIGFTIIFITEILGIVFDVVLKMSMPFVIYGISVFVMVVTFCFLNEVRQLYRSTIQANEDLENAVNTRTKQLEEQIEIAVSANRAKSSFLASMSHEIRTPMNAILGLSEVELESRSISGSDRINIEKIYGAGKMLLGLINDILDLSKIESGKMVFNPVKYSFYALITDVIQLNIIKIGVRPIVFKLDIAEKFPAELFGDDLRVKQLLNNILSNAFKYTDEGEVRLDIQYENVSEAEVRIIFRLADTGQGMSEEQVSELFSEYSRFVTESNRGIEGTGLGMSISKKLATSMNGDIFVESEIGVGSVFNVQIMQTRTDGGVLSETEIQSLREMKLMSTGSSAVYIPVMHKKMTDGKVLVVDDVETNLYVASHMLGLYGIAVETAPGGAEAIELIKKEGATEYDIIFMDQMMPVDISFISRKD